MSMGKFAIETTVYKGPLEALLDIIEARKLSISDISLAQVADGYLSYVEKLPELPLGETAQFVLVASTLLLIKSRSLLPMLELSVDERESVEELQRRLTYLKRIHNAAKLLRKEWGRAPLLFPHRTPLREPVFAPAGATIQTFYGALSRLIDLLPQPNRLADTVVAPILALEEVIENLRIRLSTTLKTRWSEIIKGTSQYDSIVHFLAILELVRAGSASVTQDRLFDDIIIEAEGSHVPHYGI